MRGKVLRGRLSPGASIGLDTQEESSEILYRPSGGGQVLCDGVYEDLAPGGCHYCPKGHTHSLSNDGTEPLEFFAVVPNQ
mgnify:FL=1